MSKTQTTMTWTYLQRAKKRRERTNSKQIFRLLYNIGQTILFSKTFSAQHLVAAIRTLLHGESRWKKSIKHQLSHIFFMGYKIYFFSVWILYQQGKGEANFFSSSLPFSPASKNRSFFSICIFWRGLMMNEDFASGSRNRTTSFYYQNLYNSK